MNETLEAMARALFKDWFRRLRPRPRQDGRPRALPPAGRLVPLPRPPRAVGARRHPGGVADKGARGFVTLNPREPMKKGTVAPYLDMAALPTSGPSSDDAVLREFTSGTRFRNGDTLLARITPCLENGKTAFVQSLPEDRVGWGSTEFIVMRVIPPVPPEYTYLLARDPTFRAYAIQSMTGTSGRQRARTEALVPYPLVFPQRQAWSALASIVTPMFAKIKSNHEEINTLAASGMRCYRRWCRAECG